MIQIEKIKLALNELNTDSSSRWEDYRHVELDNVRDGGDTLELDLAIGHKAFFTVSVTAEGWEVIFSSAENTKASNVLEDVMTYIVMPCLFDIRHTLGRQLRALRIERGLTTRQLAEAADTSQAHIVRIEAGRYNLRVDTVERICNALGARLIIKKRDTR